MQRLREACQHDHAEFVVRYRPDGITPQFGTNARPILEGIESSLEVPRICAQWNEDVEWEEVRDKCVRRPVIGGIVIDARDASDGHVASTPAASLRLSVHDPISDTLSSFRQIPVGEMVPMDDVIIVQSLRSRVENSFHGFAAPLL